jgi:hypothetical protein
MPYSTTLEDKIEDITLSRDDLEKKKMFGGICYLINGNMFFGVWKDYLIVRMGPDLAAEKLKHDHLLDIGPPESVLPGEILIIDMDKGSSSIMGNSGTPRLFPDVPDRLPKKRRPATYACRPPFSYIENVTAFLE